MTTMNAAKDAILAKLAADLKANDDAKDAALHAYNDKANSRDPMVRAGAQAHYDEYERLRGVGTTMIEIAMHRMAAAA